LPNWRKKASAATFASKFFIMAKKISDPVDGLKGWKNIAEFLGQPLSVAQRWAKSGMPVAHEGRSVTATAEELNRWLGRESSGEPVTIATEESDLSADLKRGLAYVKKHPKKI
jgi:hypothetical protein